MNNLIRVAAAVGIACFGSAAQAALINRGSGLIYDTVLDITWLQDARPSATNTFGVAGVGFDSNGNFGVMDWYTANDWITAMNAANYKGFSSWRLPTVRPVNGTNFQYTVSYDGSTDRGFNNYSTSNELSHLFYSTLGNLGLCSTDNATGALADYCNKSAYGTWGLQNTGPFVNFFANGRIWTNVRHTDPNEERAFDFYPEHGQTGTGGLTGPKFVWAVLDGDVAAPAAIPVPGAAWLFVSGLVGLFAARKRASA